MHGAQRWAGMVVAVAVLLLYCLDLPGAAPQQTALVPASMAQEENGATRPAARTHTTAVPGATATTIRPAGVDDECGWEALQGGRGAAADARRAGCSLPTALGSLGLGFTAAEIEPCRIDPG